MKANALALACAIVVAGAAAASAQEPTDNPSLDRMKAVLQHQPLKLTPVEPEPTFKIEIHAIHPMHEVFDKPPWQLPPILWHIPAMGPSTAFGSIPLMSVDLLAIGSAVKRRFDERGARRDVQREIATYCAAQPNPATIQICSTSPAIR